MRRKSKIDELLEQVTNPGTKAFLQGFKEVTELAEHYMGGGSGTVEELLPPARNEAQAKGRELGEVFLPELIH
jgi:hypothetical protein